MLAAPGGAATNDVRPVSPVFVGGPGDYYIPSTRSNVPSPAALCLLSQGWDEAEVVEGGNKDGSLGWLKDAEEVDAEPLAGAQPTAGLYGPDE